jgi:sugar O-acyltransferase (sialic acid O-acetyltransferase NeuD family)
MKDIILIGAGGHCESCIEIIEKEKKFKILGLVDNKKKGFFLGYKILGSDKDLLKLRSLTDNSFVTLGQIKNYEKRKKIFKKLLKLKFYIPQIISNLSYISKKTLIKNGVIVMNGCIINSGSVIGNNCIINNGSIIEHNVIIGDNCHISVGAIINGNTRIGNNCFIGSGAIIKNKISIGNNCIIGMGKVVKRNVLDNEILK